MASPTTQSVLIDRSGVGRVATALAALALLGASCSLGDGRSATERRPVVGADHHRRVAEFTFDVVGIGDDAVAGFRLRVSAAEDDNGESFTLRDVERTTFSTRGLDGEPLPLMRFSGFVDMLLLPGDHWAVEADADGSAQGSGKT